MPRTDEDDGKAQTGKLERGYKSNSYIFAIENNAVPLQQRHFEADVASGSELLIYNSRGGRTLNYDQLCLYRDDPFWRRLRWCLLLLFWLAWFFLFATAIFMVFASPKCAELSSRKWWQTGIIYEIWTSSFQDSNNDGFGDLKGIQSRLNKLRKIGVNTIFARQFVDAEDSGMGVQNFVSVEPSIGTMKDVVELIKEAHEKDFRVVIDFPLVVTSAGHKWFRRSAAASLPENVGFAEFYYWRRNVQSTEHVTEYQNSSVFYFHVKNRPDLPILNWNSRNVSQALKKAVSFWIDKDVDGFHLSSVEYLHRSFDGLELGWDGIAAILRDLRKHISDYSRESLIAKGKDVFVFSSPENLKEEQKQKLILDDGLDAVVNTELTRVALKNKICYESENSVAGCVNEIISDLLLFHSSKRSQNIWPMWISGSSFISRLASRVGSRPHGEIITILQLLLPGTSMFYYGEEIGLRDSLQNPDFPQRGAMLWDDSSNAGFSNVGNASSLSAHIHPDFSSFNFESQYSNSRTQLKTFRRLARLRSRSELLISGRTYISKPIDNGFAFCRYSTELDNSTFTEVFVMAMNFGGKAVKQTLLDLPPFQSNPHRSINLNRGGEVVAVSSGSENYYLHQKIDISSGEIELEADEGVVFSLS